MRRQRFAVLWAFPWLALLVVAGLPTPAQAQASLGLFGGVYEPEDGDQVEIWGLSGEYRFNASFGLEASLGSVELPDSFSSCPRGTYCIALVDPALVVTPVEVDAYTLDLSAAWRPRGGDAVLFAGPGVALFDYTAKSGFEPAGFESREEIVTLHAGVGYEWSTGGRLSVRPEVRARHYLAEAIGAGFAYTESGQTDVQLSVSLGWRLER